MNMKKQTLNSQMIFLFLTIFRTYKNSQTHKYIKIINNIKFTKIYDLTMLKVMLKKRQVYIINIQNEKNMSYMTNFQLICLKIIKYK